MTYVTSVERIGYERDVKEGRAEGLEQGSVQTMREAILELLEVRFGITSTTVLAGLACIEDLARLKALLRKTTTVSSLNEFEALLTQSPEDNNE